MREDRMLYKHPGTEQMHNGFFDTLIVDEAAPGELQAAIKAGWSLTTTEALARSEAEVQKAIEAEIRKPKKVVKVDDTVAAGYTSALGYVAVGYESPIVGS